jgi:outer membrane lipoprotein-sorting protein
MIYYRHLYFVTLLFVFTTCQATDANQLYNSMRTKVLLVKDYEADVKMKIDVAYMQVPLLKGKLYFKSPDKMRLERNGGISIMPKKNVNLTLSNLIPTGKVTVIDAGMAAFNGKNLRILKVIPEDDLNNIVLTKVWIDEANLLIIHTETTTHNDGTIIMSLEYGSYSNYALPDKVTIFMDLKDYKLPKSITMDYNETPQTPARQAKKKWKKGTIEINYLKYQINKGLSDELFLKKQEE